MNKEQNYSVKATVINWLPSQKLTTIYNLIWRTGSVANCKQRGPGLLQQHVEKGPQNVQYTFKFSALMLLEAIDTWLDRKLMESLRSSPKFSVLADECVDICTTEELSLCCQWIVNGKPEEHFLTILYISALDAANIPNAIYSFLESKNLNYRKLVGQGYDEAAVFPGKYNWVQKRMQSRAAHSMYIHFACHRLQLASMQAAKRVPEVNKMFGTFGNLWKFFFYLPKGKNFSRMSSPSSSYWSLKLWSLMIPGGSHMNAVYELLVQNFLPLSSH